MALTTAQVRSIKANINKVLSTNTGKSPRAISKILPGKNVQGKLYEAHVLSEIIDKLVNKEKFTVRMVNSGPYRLKQKGGPVNTKYPYFEVFQNKKLLGEIFTDIEFTGISFDRSGTAHPSSSDYHELDIAMFRPSPKGRPPYIDVLLAVECKATNFEKSTFRELLGFRRELAYIFSGNMTVFTNYYSDVVSSDPGSLHLCYSTDSALQKYKRNAEEFGIYLYHLPM